WLFTPMPSCSQRSRSSLLLSPSSFASSCTRGFLGKEVPNACRISAHCDPSGPQFLVSRSYAGRREVRSEPLQRSGIDVSLQRLGKRLPADGGIEALERTLAEPGTP